jgi:hypothetical protein
LQVAIANNLHLAFTIPKETGPATIPNGPEALKQEGDQSAARSTRQVKALILVVWVCKRAHMGA